jgi:hypothetical protein
VVLASLEEEEEGEGEEEEEEGEDGRGFFSMGRSIEGVVLLIWEEEEEEEGREEEGEAFLGRRMCLNGFLGICSLGEWRREGGREGERE